MGLSLFPLDSYREKALSEAFERAWFLTTQVSSPLAGPKADGAGPALGALLDRSTTGCAAHPSFKQALQAACLEYLERTFWLSWWNAPHASTGVSEFEWGMGLVKADFDFEAFLAPYQKPESSPGEWSAHHFYQQAQEVYFSICILEHRRTGLVRVGTAARYSFDASLQASTSEALMVILLDSANRSQSKLRSRFDSRFEDSGDYGLLWQKLARSIETPVVLQPDFRRWRPSVAWGRPRSQGSPACVKVRGGNLFSIVPEWEVQAPDYFIYDLDREPRS